ncbi:MAG: S4 domain-containing protein YaaA [Cyanobacteria bacterium SZAS LIN-2]|nr:S4 domain-containing protein YaaA [Cyanobacteria bacterium SZAS LIN-3]MBS1997599.1 S4 domain-containing protein YaaA [Cyanobacteria bacterium SZAS LIN-2]MBS2007809.1 S4 domain-containing protein YaaA [Cyanobacteria bacterium SZAS TMP-1]
MAGEEEQEVVIRGEFITLGQLLKLVGEVGSGGNVKDYLAEISPLVNGEPECRRGRKLRPGDRIELEYQGHFLIA